VAMRALPFHQCGPGLITTQCIWVEFVVGSHLPDSISPGSLVFVPLQKPTSPNSNSTRMSEDQHENQLRLIWLPM